MPLYHLVIIALIQGITEFLPVSSSGHLILLPGLTGLTDQGPVIDVAAHVGTLLAVIVYFWSDVRHILQGVPQVVRGQFDTPSARLFIAMSLATLPVMVLGLILKLTGLSDALRSITVIGWSMLVFGILLYWMDQRAQTTRQLQDLTLRDAWILGLWQATGADPRHLAFRHHHHRRPQCGLHAQRGRPHRHADVDPDHYRLWRAHLFRFDRRHRAPARYIYRRCPQLRSSALGSQSDDALAKQPDLYALCGLPHRARPHAAHHRLQRRPRVVTP